MISNKSSVGLFSFGSGVTISNLRLFNFIVNGTTVNSYVGSLFGYMQNSQLSNIFLSATGSTARNRISGSEETNYLGGGGLIGGFDGGFIRNITVENTIVSFKYSTGGTGGLIGKSAGMNIRNSHNIGFLFFFFF